MKVLIVDDHPVMRMGVRALVRQIWADAEVRDAETLAQAVEALGDDLYDLVVIDLQLPDADGLEAPRCIKPLAHGASLFVLSSTVDSACVAEVLRMGVAGFITKDQAPHVLRAALRRVRPSNRPVPRA